MLIKKASPRISLLFFVILYSGLAEAMTNCRWTLHGPEKKAAAHVAETAIDKPALHEALTGKEAQDEQPYFYRALLRNPERKAKIEALATAMLDDFQSKNPTASPVQKETFMKDLNKMFAWGLSDDHKFTDYSDEAKRLTQTLGEGSVEHLRNQLHHLSGEFAQHNRHFEEGGVASFVEELSKANPRYKKEETLKELTAQLDALYIADTELHFHTAIKINELMKKYPQMKGYEQKEALGSILRFMRSEGRGARFNHDDVPLRAAGFIGDENKTWPLAKAQSIVPEQGDLKSYFDFTIHRLEALNTSGLLPDKMSSPERPRTDNRGMVGLMRIMDAESDNHLRVNPWSQKLAESIADYVAFQRLRMVKPKLAAESPNVIIPKHIINEIIDNHLLSGNYRDNHRNPRFREFDEAALRAIDAELLDYFKPRR